MNPAIPDTLLSDINNLADALSTDLGESLRSLVLYGGPVKNDLVKDTDRINLMIVLTDTHTATLDKVGNVLQAAKRGRQFQPMVLTEADLNSSTDVFPIKFLDMQQDYEVLKGEDVVKGLEIGRENLRLRCEMEIKNLMLRLRRMYLSSRNNPEALRGSMLKSYYSFLQAGDALAEIKTDKINRKEDEILDALDAIGLNVDVLRRIAEYRTGSPGTAEEAKDNFEKLMRLVEKAAAMADAA
tara:strand:+ start:118 stop:840 length:723 start_codon:yes stop_codon:yes gene_type:complete